MSAIALPILPGQQESEQVNTTTDWVERVHPENGQVFFYNVKTRQTSWERPDELEKQGKGAWEVCLHPDNGLPFYRNRRTGEQTW